MNASIRKGFRWLKSMIFHPAFGALIVVTLVEWWYYDFESITNLLNQPITAIVRFAVFYFLGFVGIRVLLKLNSETEFETEPNLRSKLVELIKESREYCYIVSPYLDPGNVILEPIIAAHNRGVHVTVIHNSNQLMKSNLHDDFNRLLSTGVKILHHPRLHAKVYVSERFALITSLNLVAGSYKDSFEAGISTDDRNLRLKAKQFIESEIVQSDQTKPTTMSNLPPANGHCISTKKTIPFNLKSPVEREEYLARKPNIEGNYCHACGGEVHVSLTHPLCANCQNLYGMSPRI